jgi:hypothetical protein
MTALKLYSSLGNICLTVPYELNPAFREIFKSAKWNPTSKVFEVKDTVQNRNKWEKFLALAEDASKVLATADFEDATAQALQQAAQRLEQALTTTNHRIDAAKKEAAAATEMAQRFAPLLDEANERLAKLEEEKRGAVEARDAVIAPILRIYESHKLDVIIDDYLSGARRGYAGKPKCEAAEGCLIAVRKAIRAVGFEVPAMDELLGTSLNRADKLREAAEALQRTKTSGLRPYVRSVEA